MRLLSWQREEQEGEQAGGEGGGEGDRMTIWHTSFGNSGETGLLDHALYHHQHLALPQLQRNCPSQYLMVNLLLTLVYCCKPTTAVTYFWPVKACPITMAGPHLPLQDTPVFLL